jgi:chorismate synthase
MLRFTTAGESHGIALVSILEGMVAGLPLVAADIDADLTRRQQGYGRGRRMKIESDHAEILSGVRAGETLSSPIATRSLGPDLSRQMTESAYTHRTGAPPRYVLDSVPVSYEATFKF